jgi:hypothetical protein
VVGGHKAIKGQHFDETYSPVLSLVILRMILSIFAGWPHVITTVADAVQAYLNSKLLEEVHVWAPKGIPVPRGYVLKLLKAIYGMPQGGREYWKLIRSVIIGLGFTQSEHAPCFFYRRSDAGFIIVMTYVDDMTITTDNELMRNEVFDAINSVMEIKDLGVLESFLGMHFKYNKQLHYWHISQGTYIKDLCATMGLHQGSAKAAFTPEIKRNWSAETSTAKDDAERLRVSQYSPRSKIGSIMWAMVCSRPDLMHCLKHPSQYLTDPGDMVVDALQRIGRYLLGTADEGLRLQGFRENVGLHVASDADDAGGVSRRSMLCYMQWLGPPLGDESTLIPRAFFQWNSAWSIPVASGSMESEIYAVHAATKGSASNRGLLGEIGLHDGTPTSLAVDSSSSKIVLQGEHAEKNSTGIKHIDRRIMAIRQLFAAGIYTIDWVPSADNPADIGATYKSKVEFTRLRAMIMGYEFPRSPCNYLCDTEEPSHWPKKKDKKDKTTPLLATSAGKVE